METTVLFRPFIVTFFGAKGARNYSIVKVLSRARFPPFSWVLAKTDIQGLLGTRCLCAENPIPEALHIQGRWPALTFQPKPLNIRQ